MSILKRLLKSNIAHAHIRKIWEKIETDSLKPDYIETIGVLNIDSNRDEEAKSCRSRSLLLFFCRVFLSVNGE